MTTKITKNNLKSYIIEELKGAFLISEASAGLQRKLLDGLATENLMDGLEKIPAAGSPREKLRILQTYLFQKGHFDGVAAKLGRQKLRTIRLNPKTGKRIADGLWGRETVEAIKNLQRKLGFKEKNDKSRSPLDGVVDGSFGNDTLTALSDEQRISSATGKVGVGTQPTTDASARAETQMKNDLAKSKKKGMELGREVVKTAIGKFKIQNKAALAADDKNKKAELKSLNNPDVAAAYLKKGDPSNIVAIRFEEEKANISKLVARIKDASASELARKRERAKASAEKAAAVAQKKGDKKRKEKRELDRTLAGLEGTAGKITSDPDDNIQFPKSGEESEYKDIEDLLRPKGPKESKRKVVSYLTKIINEELDKVLRK